MEEYREMVVCYWQVKTEELGEKYYTVCEEHGWMSVEQRWNETDGKIEAMEEKSYKTYVVDGLMSMQQCWNDTDIGKLNYLEKTLQSMGGRWLNECGAMVEWYWQGKFEVHREKYFWVRVACRWMGTEKWRIVTDRGNVKNCRKVL